RRARHRRNVGQVVSRNQAAPAEVGATAVARAVLVRQALRQLASPARAEGTARFFKSGRGEYGEGDVFIGVTVPDQRRVARRFRLLPIAEVDLLLTSRVHEERLTALLILVDRFNGSCNPREREKIFRLYLKRLSCVNNWDLV